MFYAWKNVSFYQWYAPPCRNIALDYSLQNPKEIPAQSRYTATRQVMSGRQGWGDFLLLWGHFSSDRGELYMNTIQMRGSGVSGDVGEVWESTYMSERQKRMRGFFIIVGKCFIRLRRIVCKWMLLLGKCQNLHKYMIAYMMGEIWLHIWRYFLAWYVPAISQYITVHVHQPH